MPQFRPAGWHSITPRIFTADVDGLVRFLRTVFDAEGDVRAGAPSEIRIGDSLVMISDGSGLRGARPAFLYVYVENADATYRRAMQTGARSVEEPMDTPYGDRRATIEDEWGNSWQIATFRGTE